MSSGIFLTEIDFWHKMQFSWFPKRFGGSSRVLVATVESWFILGCFSCLVLKFFQVLPLISFILFYNKVSFKFLVRAG
jgi:hypothetical protein